MERSLVKTSVSRPSPALFGTLQAEKSHVLRGITAASSFVDENYGVAGGAEFIRTCGPARSVGNGAIMHICFPSGESHSGAMAALRQSREECSAVRDFSPFSGGHRTRWITATSRETNGTEGSNPVRSTIQSAGLGTIRRIARNPRVYARSNNGGRLAVRYTSKTDFSTILPVLDPPLSQSDKPASPLVNSAKNEAPAPALRPAPS